MVLFKELSTAFCYFVENFLGEKLGVINKKAQYN